MDDEKVKNFIRKAAQGQTPDAWGNIERRLKKLDNGNEHRKANTGWRRGITVAAAACAVLALAAVAVLAKPGLLGGTPATSAPAATASQAAVSPVATVTPASTPVATAKPAPTADPMQVREPVPFVGGSGMTPVLGPSMKIMLYAELSDFAKKPETIAEFKFVKQVGSKSGEDPNRLYTDYEMQVTKVLKGGLKPGDTITVQVFGGANDKAWIEDNFVERFTGDFDYVLFLNSTDDNGKAVYQLTSSYQGYVPVLNGKVSLNTKIADNGLYTQGETLADLETRIQDALK